jgi:hypothetical protein
MYVPISVPSSSPKALPNMVDWRMWRVSNRASIAIPTMAAGGSGARTPRTRINLSPILKGLEGILSVVLVAQHRPADPQHHRAVPFQVRRERELGPLSAPAANRLSP